MSRRKARASHFSSAFLPASSTTSCSPTCAAISRAMSLHQHALLAIQTPCEGSHGCHFKHPIPKQLLSCLLRPHDAPQPAFRYGLAMRHRSVTSMCRQQAQWSSANPKDSCQPGHPDQSLHNYKGQCSQHCQRHKPTSCRRARAPGSRFHSTSMPLDWIEFLPLLRRRSWNTSSSSRVRPSLALWLKPSSMGSAARAS